ncbi:BF2992 family fimbrillin-A clan protein [Parabacteroides bouchesdurhonensis]|uniref:BF2992 family fimbrillin-A clan protein n=1 Tax=Parabacteroides bouchesdurhonensis TaxID=1936995 RepID=UPI000E50EAAC|nr:fimbrillin family protein [Parabacteroides bouchesdurhonensis]RHJ91683.1 hypothetical protein DW095_09185 [Bacteroides sp. AM07-16]
MKRFYLYRIILPYRTLLASACCLLLAGCTGSPVEDIVPEEALPVELSFGRPGLGVTTVTRAGGDPANLPEGATVRIAAYYLGHLNQNVSSVAYENTKPAFEATYVVEANGSLSPCVVDDDGKKTGNAATGMLVRSGKYDFYAVSPARPITEKDGTFGIYGIPHKEDVITSWARTVTVSKASNSVTLQTFRRQCALVVFNVAADASSAVSMINLKGTKLELSSISSSPASLVAGESREIDKTGGDITGSGTVSFGADDFKPVDPASDPNNLGLNKVTGVVLPKNDTSFNIAVTVERDGTSVDLSAIVNKNIAFDAGKRYVFTLQVKNDVSRLVMRVMDWNTIVFTDGNVGGADPDNPNPDPDINEGVGVGVVVAEWTNIDWSGNGNVG